MNWNDWYINYMSTRIKTERLGQAFCNDFVSYSWPDLYYCVDQYDAYGKIWDLLDAKGVDSFQVLTKELMEIE